MKPHFLPLVLLGLTWVGTGAAGWAQAPAASRSKAAYQRPAAARTKARAGAYARYDRSGRRDEENLKLAPGMRLNMPSPPTTDYMGRPLKKKPAKQPPKQPTGPTTISADGGPRSSRRP